MKLQIIKSFSTSLFTTERWLKTVLYLFDRTKKNIILKPYQQQTSSSNLDNGRKLYAVFNNMRELERNITNLYHVQKNKKLIPVPFFWWK